MSDSIYFILLYLLLGIFIGIASMYGSSKINNKIKEKVEVKPTGKIIELNRIEICKRLIEAHVDFNCSDSNEDLMRIFNKKFEGILYLPSVLDYPEIKGEIPKTKELKGYLGKV